MLSSASMAAGTIVAEEALGVVGVVGRAGAASPLS